MISIRPETPLTSQPDQPSSALPPEELQKIHAYWRACNYLAVGMIYLQNNPLLKQPLTLAQIKPRLLGHWGTSPGLSFIYIHLNRLIKKYDLNMIFMAGPGHGAPGVLAPIYLEGTYSEVYPDQSQDAEGPRKFFTQFSFPGHIGSHCTPEMPATAILREHLPDLKMRFINVVDLYKLIHPKDHCHGLSEMDFNTLFTIDKPVIFNFHGYPWLIHKLTYARSHQDRIHVRGYKEKGNINTPLELAIRNQIDRFNLVIDVINRVPKLGAAAAHLKEQMKDAIIGNLNYAFEYGKDQDELVNWQWPFER